MKTRNLLLGNGINIHFGISELYLNSIAKRFHDILINSSSLYYCLFGVSITPDVCDKIYAEATNWGIETLASGVYKYIHANMHDQNSVNCEYRLLNAVKTSALNAIFFDNSRFIQTPKLECEEICHIMRYDNIFTLNYTEFWDNEERSIYLHGKYKNTNYNDTHMPILLYSSEQHNLSEYRKVVSELGVDYNMVEFEGYDIVFSPLLDKQAIMGVGHYPSKHLYPADDLFPGETRKLYTELRDISTLDVFGMSPFGDDNLIDILAGIPDLTVFVYQMNNKEVNEWNRKLGKECCVDGNLFWK